MSDTAETPVKKQSLFDIVAESQKLMAQLFEAGGEITPEIEAALERVGTELITKVDNYVGFMDRLGHEVDFFKSRKAEMDKAKKSMENLQARLKQTVFDAMKTLKKDEVQGETYRLVIQNSANTYDINEGAVPAGYFIETVVKSLDKERLLEDVKMGLEVDGVTVKKNQYVKKYAATSQKSAKKKTAKKTAKKKVTKKTPDAKKEETNVEGK